MFSLAVQNFIEAVDTILVEDSYQLPSPVASNCLTAAKVLNIWMKKPENNSELDLFSKHLHSNLSKSTRLLLNTKRMSKGREKMWKFCHELRISSQFREEWKSFLKVTKETVHPHLSQDITVILFRKMIQVRTRIIDHSENDLQPITQSEENALRYAAGYVVRKVTENIEHSKRPLPLKLKLLSGLEMLRDENSSEHPHDSSAWIDMIDRGGLWHGKDIVYPVFYAMEEEMRRQVHQLSPQHPTLDVKNLLD